MFLGRVIGTVWSSVKWDDLSGYKLLLVRPYSFADLGGEPSVPAGNSDGVVCADVLGAGVGEDVVVAYGHAARRRGRREARAGRRDEGPRSMPPWWRIVDRYNDAPTRDLRSDRSRRPR